MCKFLPAAASWCQHRPAVMPGRTWPTVKPCNNCTPQAHPATPGVQAFSRFKTWRTAAPRRPCCRHGDTVVATLPPNGLARSLARSLGPWVRSLGPFARSPARARSIASPVRASKVHARCDSWPRSPPPLARSHNLRRKVFLKTRRYGGAGRAGGAAEGDQQGLELSPSKLGLIYSHLSPDPVGGLRDSAASVSESEKKENRRRRR